MRRSAFSILLCASARQTRGGGGFNVPVNPYDPRGPIEDGEILLERVDKPALLPLQIIVLSVVRVSTLGQINPTKCGPIRPNLAEFGT